LAIGGHWFQPHLVKMAAPKLLRDGNFNPDNVQQIVAGMYGVVNEGGTGHAAALPNVKVCGKTGTAQVASLQLTKGRTTEALKDNAWFVGYAPEEAPEVVVVAFFENGEHGDRAAWMVRDVLKAYFDKKTREGKFPSQSAFAPRLLLNAPKTPLGLVTLPVPEGVLQ
jgi:penicillin-binding protein 2